MQMKILSTWINQCNTTLESCAETLDAVWDAGIIYYSDSVLCIAFLGSRIFAFVKRIQCLGKCNNLNDVTWFKMQL